MNPHSVFKSKGEREIAHYLESRRMAYQYEYPLAIVDRGQTRIWYPDFRLPDSGMIIEYFGVNGDSNYNEQMINKMRVYREAGIEGVYLMEPTMRGPWQEMIDERIEQVLKGRLEKFYHQSSRGSIAG